MINTPHRHTLTVVIEMFRLFPPKIITFYSALPSSLDETYTHSERRRKFYSKFLILEESAVGNVTTFVVNYTPIAKQWNPIPGARSPVQPKRYLKSYLMELFPRIAIKIVVDGRAIRGELALADRTQFSPGYVVPRTLARPRFLQMQNEYNTVRWGAAKVTELLCRRVYKAQSRKRGGSVGGYTPRQNIRELDDEYQGKPDSVSPVSCSVSVSVEFAKCIYGWLVEWLFRLKQVALSWE